MNTKKLSLLLIISFLLFACNGRNSKSTEKNDVPVDTIVADDTLQYVNFPVDTAVVSEKMTFNGWTFDFNAVVAVLPSVTDNAFLDDIYHSFTLGQTLGFQPQNYSKENIQKYLKEWGEMKFKNAKDEAISDETDEMPFDYYYSATILPASYDKNLLVITLAEEAYYGGAHGSYIIEYKVFDLNTKKQIRNTDIFKDVKDAALEKTMLKYLKKEYDENADASWQDCLFDEYRNQIPVNDNFYFDKNRIYFTYNQYEITPYVCGVIGFSLPFNEIQKYLEPDFLKLLEKYL